MARRYAPEVTSLNPFPFDLEASASNSFGGGKTIALDGVPKIQPFVPQSFGGDASKNRRGSAATDDALSRALLIAGGIWLLGVFVGYDWTWPLQVALDLLVGFLTTPPFSWFFGWLLTPLQWMFGWMYKGAPLVAQSGALQELRLPQDQVHTYVDNYVHTYGDAGLIFAAHDGYPQLVTGLLVSRELGYHDLIDAADENGNTALIYATSKGYRQTSSILLHSGADPDVANRGAGGRTPLMEAAGGGFREIAGMLRLANATLDLVDDFQNTALHYAAYHGHLPVVQELMKGNPRRDIQNSYGHTPASYAAANKHKAIADLLSREPTQREKDRQARMQEKALNNAKKVTELGSGSHLADEASGLFNSVFSHHTKEEKHVKGAAEKLHETASGGDWVPKRESGGNDDAERHALEEQISTLKRHHDEADLRTQKRIVELLEKNSAHQKALDDKDRETRELRLNHTELQMKVQDLESLRHSAELRTSEERARSDRLREEKQSVSLELDRYKSRTEGAERERDLHIEAAKRHEETIKRKQDEINEHLAHLERQSRELTELREEARRNGAELRLRQERLEQLEKQLHGSGVVAAAPSPETAAVTPPQASTPAEQSSTTAAPSNEGGSAATLEPTGVPHDSAADATAQAP